MPWNRKSDAFSGTGTPYTFPPRAARFTSDSTSTAVLEIVKSVSGSFLCPTGRGRLAFSTAFLIVVTRGNLVSQHLIRWGVRAHVVHVISYRRHAAVVH